MKPTPEQLSKLPQWAQEHIADIERRRDDAIRVMDQSMERAHKTPFFFEDMIRFNPESNEWTDRRVYFGHEWGRSIAVEFGGVRLDVTCRDNGNTPEISINFRREEDMRGDVMVEPRACNSIAFRLPRR